MTSPSTSLSGSAVADGAPSTLDVASGAAIGRNNILLVAALLILDSMHFIFARLLLPNIKPGASVTYVLAVSTLEVGIVGLARRKLHAQTARRYVGFFLAIGTLIAGSTMINYEAVAFIDPGTASLLSQTSILFSLGFGLFWLRDPLAPRQIGGALLALAGVFVITFQPGDYLRVGALLVIASALMYALHAALTKRFSGALDLLEFFFYRLLFTTGVLFALATVRGVLVWPTAKAWGLIILVGTVDVVLSRTLYYLALRRLSMSIHTIVLTLTPIASITWALLLFGTLPSIQQLVGGAAVITGVLIVSLRHRVSEKAIKREGGE
jgi:drug/metabolite transporter (DMT)-like permease